MAFDLGCLMKTGKSRIPVQYLARPAGAVGQTAVAVVGRATFIGDGRASFETQPDFFEKVGSVFLTFVT